MPDYLLYTPAVETPEPDEADTHAKIVDLMTEGMHNVRAKYGKSVRISHAKAHGLLKGTLTVASNLPPELAQGLFAQPGSYEVVVRLATAPGEYLDDSKVSTARGMSLKVLQVGGTKIAGHAEDTQDFVLDTGKEFFNSDAKSFLQTFKANAELAPKLSDNVKGAVSEASQLANKALNAVGLDSGKLDFFGHPRTHPLAEYYYSQTPYRYGRYVAKFAAFPSSPGLQALKDKEQEMNSPDALRNLCVEYFRSNPAEYTLMVQLNTGLEEMSVEDGKAKWSEELSPYRVVAKLELPQQEAFDPAREDYFEPMSFSPAHALVEHQPLGSINRARLVAYTALSARRMAENGTHIRTLQNTEAVPA